MEIRFLVALYVVNLIIEPLLIDGQRSPHTVSRGPKGYHANFLRSGASRHVLPRSFKRYDVPLQEFSVTTEKSRETTNSVTTTTIPTTQKMSSNHHHSASIVTETHVREPSIPRGQSHSHEVGMEAMLKAAEARLTSQRLTGVMIPQHIHPVVQRADSLVGVMNQEPNVESGVPTPVGGTMPANLIPGLLIEAPAAVEIRAQKSFQTSNEQKRVCFDTVAIDVFKNYDADSCSFQAKMAGIYLVIITVGPEYSLNGRPARAKLVVQSEEQQDVVDYIWTSAVAEPNHWSQVTKPSLVELKKGDLLWLETPNKGEVFFSGNWYSKWTIVLAYPM